LSSSLAPPIARGNARMSQPLTLARPDDRRPHPRDGAATAQALLYAARYANAPSSCRSGES
jgi:hypothetical protein